MYIVVVVLLLLTLLLLMIGRLFAWALLLVWILYGYIVCFRAVCCCSLSSAALTLTLPLDGFLQFAVTKHVCCTLVLSARHFVSVDFVGGFLMTSDRSYARTFTLCACSALTIFVLNDFQ